MTLYLVKKRETFGKRTTLFAKESQFVDAVLNNRLEIEFTTPSEFCPPKKVMIKKLKKKSKQQKEQQKNTGKPFKNEAFDQCMKLLEQFKQSDIVINVVDARNPNACRYGPYEELLGKRLVFVINKIDLAPREAVIAWMRTLMKTNLTFALQANKDTTCLTNFLKKIPTESSPVNILITGFPKVGKSTLEKSMPSIPGLEITVSRGWTWMEPTSDLVALGCSEVSTISTASIAHARDWLSRCSIHSVMDVFEVPFFNDVDIVFPTIDKNKRSASLEFFRAISHQKLHFYTCPIAAFVSDSMEGIAADQAEALKSADPLDCSECKFLVLGYGTQNVMKSGLAKMLIAAAEK